MMFAKIKNFLKIGAVQSLENTIKRPSKTIEVPKIKLTDKTKNLTRSPVFKSDGWMNILNGLGVPGRDKTVSGTFRSCPNFCAAELDELYRSDGLSRRIVDIIPAEMLRQGWEINGDENGLIKSVFEKLDLNCKLNQLIQWSRLYGGAICVIGIADGRPLNEPVNETNIKSVNWLQIFDKWQTVINFDLITSDINSKNYGLPEFYQVNDYRSGTMFVVHYTRVLRMDWGVLPPRDKYLNSGWGDSIFVSIYNEIRAYGTAFANVSAIMQDFVNGILQIPGLSNSLAQDCGDSDQALMRRLNFANLSKGATNMMVLDGEETYTKLSTNVSGIDGLLDRFMLSVSAVTGIPITLLFGRSPAGLSATGDSDIRNFYDLVKQYQEMKLKPILEKLIGYIAKSEYGPFSGVEPENWSIQFTPLWQNTEEQEAVMRRTVAETDRIYIENGVLDATEVAISRFGGGHWSMNTLIDEQAREGGYNEGETAELEIMKQKEIEKMPPEPTIGPDFMSSGQGENVIVVTN